MSSCMQQWRLPFMPLKFSEANTHKKWREAPSSENTGNKKTPWRSEQSVWPKPLLHVLASLFLPFLCDYFEMIKVGSSAIPNIILYLLAGKYCIILYIILINIVSSQKKPPKMKWLNIFNKITSILKRRTHMHARVVRTSVQWIIARGCSKAWIIYVRSLASPTETWPAPSISSSPLLPVWPHRLHFAAPPTSMLYLCSRCCNSRHKQTNRPNADVRSAIQRCEHVIFNWISFATQTISTSTKTNAEINSTYIWFEFRNHSNVAKAAMYLTNKEQRSVQSPAAVGLTCRLCCRRLQDVRIECTSCRRQTQPPRSPSSHCGLEEWKRDAADRWRRSGRSGADAAADTWNGSRALF